MKKLLKMAIILIMASGLMSCNERNSLKKFADHKENFAFMLRGRVTYEGDTVFFNLIPAVIFQIAKPGHRLSWEKSDQITIKTTDGEIYQFFRSMANLNGVPNPTGDGKFMEAWRPWSRNLFQENNPAKKDQAQIKRALAVFDQIIEKGEIEYDATSSSSLDELKERFLNFGYSQEQSLRLAEIASQPTGKMPKKFFKR